MDGSQAEGPELGWRVQRVGSVYEDFGTEMRAYGAVRDLAALGIELKVWHWVDGSWRLHEHINA